MTVFTCKFEGHWPVGACAIVVATDLEHAKALLSEELTREGLSLKDDEEWQEVNEHEPRAIVLLNGDY